MRLDDERRSDNVEDGRGESGGGGGGFSVGHGIGIGGVLVLVVGYFMGVDPSTLLSLLNGGGSDAPISQPQQTAPPADSKDPQVDFVRAVLGSTERVWGAYFQGMGKEYVQPKLHLFSGRVSSACGMASSASGPFYCPGDQKVYIDLAFYRQLASDFGAPGEFARAYVIAHEVGHHVQNLLGVTQRAEEMEQSAGRTGANHVSVEVELQADCYAGVWAQIANQTKKILEPGDLESGLGAASAVGDDTLQKKMQGTVVPDSFTHGSSAQRVKWFKRGFEGGKIEACNTFSAGDSL
jgi:predicted metalloprotease